MNDIHHMKYIFIQSFLVTRKWEVILNRLAGNNDLTLKQMMLLLVIHNAFDFDPSIKDISKESSTSHQNVKVIVDQLVKKSFVTIYKDKDDRRKIRVRVSPEGIFYMEQRNGSDESEIKELFNEVKFEDLETVNEMFTTLNLIADRALEK